MPAPPTHRADWKRALAPWSRPAFWFAALALTSWLLAVSWNRWVDPMVDFGTQLYIPWRITLGEHLGRDFIHPYGPLSSYVNAALFSIFGVSMRTLVVANLIVFAGIFLCLHTLLRRAFGFLPAAVATLIGIAIFGFSHLTGINNYTYAAPYSHEATHGLLLLLLLVVRLSGEWRQRDARGYVVGLLLGLIALTKVEIFFAAVITLGFFVAERFSSPVAAPHRLRWLIEIIVTAATVLLISWGALALATDAGSAAIAVASGSLSPLMYPTYAASDQGRLFLGTDAPLEHLGNLTTQGGIALAIFGAISAMGLGISRLKGPPRLLLWIVAAAATLAAVNAIASRTLLGIGDVMPGLLGGGAAALFVRGMREQRRRGDISARTFIQALLLVTGLALMSRMALSPRVFHYGFVQALVAATWLVAFFVGEWPRYLAADTAARRFVGGALAMLFLGIVVSLSGVSLTYYGMKSQPIGVGADKILGYAIDYTKGHRYIEVLRDYVVTHTSPSATLLVAPEGCMFNYLTRRKSPLRITNLLPATLSLNARDVVEELSEHPPDYVLVATRMAVDDQIRPFGSDAEHGRTLAVWILANYEVEAQAGTSPFLEFSSENVGMVLLRRKSPGPSSH